MSSQWCLVRSKTPNTLLARRSEFKRDLINLINDEQSEFSKSIHQGTNSKHSVKARFLGMRQLVSQFSPLKNKELP